MTGFYHVVKDDIVRTLKALGAKIVHLNDGSDLGKPCLGYMAGKLQEASRRWQEPLHENEEAIGILCSPLHQILPLPAESPEVVVKTEVHITRESAVEMLRQIDAARSR